MNLELRNYLYQTNPDKFTDEEVDRLEWENQMNNIPFTRIKEAEGFNIINTAINVATGFAEGLTTLPVGQWVGVEPKNTVEHIANSIGSLMGFIGVVPGPGLLGKMGVSKLFNAMGKSEAARILAEAPLKFSVKSLPMAVADKAMNVIERSGVKALAEGSKFLNSGTLIGDMAKGALHLGIASGVGAAPIYDISMESFVDQRMRGFTSGALFGAGNRLIGNLFNRGGKLDLTEMSTGHTADDIMKIAETNKDLAFELIKKSDKANTIARALSSSITFGLPSTLRDDPLELQIYEYLLNGYFGGKELSIAQRKAMELSLPFQSTGRRALLHPEKYIAGYDMLEPEVKRELQIQKEIELGGLLNKTSTATAGFLNSVTDALSEIQKKRDSGEISKKEADNLEFLYRFNTKIADLRQKGETFDEMSVLDEVVKEEAEKGNQEYVSEQEKILLKKLVGDLTNVGDYAAIEDMYKLGVAMSDLDDYYREKKMNYFRPLFKDITTAALQARGATNTQETYIHSYDLEKSLIDAMSEYKAESIGRITTEFEDILEREKSFYNKVSKALDFDIPEGSDLKKSLRKAFLNIDTAEARIPLEISPTGDIVEPSIYKDESLKTVVQYAPPPPITKIVTGFREVKEVRNVDGTKRPLHEVVAEKPGMIVDILNKLYEKNKFFIGGKKMGSNLFTGDSLIEPAEMADYFKSLGVNEGTVIKGKSLINEYSQGLARFKEMGGNTDVYNHHFINNLELWRQLNFPTLPFKEAIAKVPEGDFVITPVAFNKRTQLLGAFETGVPSELMNKEHGFDKPRYIILNAVNTDNTFHGRFDADYTDKDGSGKEIMSKEHLDGGLFVRQRSYDAMMKATGNDENTGSAKGSHVEMNPELGMLIGKYAYHVADPKLNEFMEEFNLDFVYLDTSTKQKGLRKSSDFLVTDGKLNVKDMNVYEGNWDDFTVTLTESKFKPKKWETVPAQSGDNIYDPEVQKAMIDTFVSPYVNGTDEVNAIFTQYETLLSKGKIQEANKLVDSINLEELSMKNKLTILRERTHSKGKLQKMLLMDIMNMDEDLESFKETYQDGIADKENIEYMESYLKAQGAAAKILTSGDITIATTQLPGMKRYFETALKKYMLKSYVTPKSKYIYKSVIRPHAILDFDENPLQRGRYRLGEGMRDKIIEVPEELREELGREITLGEAWDRYGHLFKVEKPTQTTPAPKTEIPEAVREMFRNPLVRVPMDSPSGLRVLMFDGFVKGQKGTGAFLRPEDMKEIGGADTDIDTVFIMFNNSSSMKKVKDYYESKKDARRNPKTGGFIDPKDDLATFKSEKEEPLYLFDPVSLYKANQMAYEGNQLLGPMLSMAKRLKVFLALHKEGDEISGFNRKGEEVWNAKIKKGAREKLETLTSSVVNFAADSADGIKLRPRQDIQKMFLDYIFEDVWGKDGKTWRQVKIGEKTSFTTEFGKNIEYEFFRLGTNPEFRRIRDFDNIFKDRNWDNKFNDEPQKYSIDEMANALRRAANGDELPGYRYKAMTMLAKENMQSVVSWRAPDVDTGNLMKLIDKVFMVQRIDGKNVRSEYAELLNKATGVQVHLNAGYQAREKALATWDKRNVKLKNEKPDIYAIKRAEFVNDIYRNDLKFFVDALFAVEKYNKLTNIIRYEDKYAFDIRNFAARLRSLYSGEREAKQNKEIAFNHLYLDDNGKVRYMNQSLE